jgi:hypothetical protein
MIFISTVRKAQTSNSLTTSLAWQGHVDYYNNVAKGHAFVKNKEAFFNIATGLMIHWALHINKQ